MLVVKIDFDSRSQLLSTIALDEKTGELVHLANYKFEDGKEVVYRTLWMDESREGILRRHIEKFGHIERRAHLFINLLRGLVNVCDGDIYDTREAIDWLIEEQDFSMRLSLEDLESGLRTVESTMGVLGTQIGHNSEWAVRKIGDSPCDMKKWSMGYDLPIGVFNSKSVH